MGRQKTNELQLINNSTIVDIYADDNFSTDKQLIINISKKLKLIKFKNVAQEQLWKLIDEKDITIITGSSGTGKTYLAIAKALSLLCDETNRYRKIILTKPAVTAQEDIGFIPGDVNAKLAPFIYSATYFIDKLIGKRRGQKLQERGLIEVMPIAYMRGVNFENCIVVFEELQNANIGQIKTLLTRIGDNAKFIITGDVDQTDRFKNSRDSGLFIAREKLQNIDEIGIFEFGKEHIVRHNVIGKILERLS